MQKRINNIVALVLIGLAVSVYGCNNTSETGLEEAHS